jgi:hypothetical protein
MRHKLLTCGLAHKHLRYVLCDIMCVYVRARACACVRACACACVHVCVYFCSAKNCLNRRRDSRYLPGCGSMKLLELELKSTLR